MFDGQSLVSPTILECIAADLSKLTRDPEARSEFPILNMVSNMIPRVSRLFASSPTPSGGRSSRQGGQLEIAFPPGGALLQGTELQLGGGLRSAMSQAHHTGVGASGGRTTADFSDRTRSDFGALPPPPRKAGVLPVVHDQRARHTANELAVCCFVRGPRHDVRRGSWTWRRTGLRLG